MRTFLLIYVFLPLQVFYVNCIRYPIGMGLSYVTYVSEGICLVYKIYRKGYRGDHASRMQARWIRYRRYVMGQQIKALRRALYNKVARMQEDLGTDINLL